MRTRKGDQSDLTAVDDGRTIVDMNVEGMPWYTPKAEDETGKPTVSRLTREESRAYTWGALKAALLVTAVMCLAIVLFVMFCQFVWFG